MKLFAGSTVVGKHALLSAPASLALLFAALALLSAPASTVARVASSSKDDEPHHRYPSPPARTVRLAQRQHNSDCNLDNFSRGTPAAPVFRGSLRDTENFRLARANVLPPARSSDPFAQMSTRGLSRELVSKLMRYADEDEKKAIAKKEQIEQIAMEKKRLRNEFLNAQNKLALMWEIKADPVDGPRRMRLLLEAVPALTVVQEFMKLKGEEEHQDQILKACVAAAPGSLEHDAWTQFFSRFSTLVRRCEEVKAAKMKDAVKLISPSPTTVGVRDYDDLALDEAAVDGVLFLIYTTQERVTRESKRLTEYWRSSLAWDDLSWGGGAAVENTQMSAAMEKQKRNNAKQIVREVLLYEPNITSALVSKVDAKLGMLLEEIEIEIGGPRVPNSQRPGWKRTLSGGRWSWRDLFRRPKAKSELPEGDVFSKPEAKEAGWFAARLFKSVARPVKVNPADDLRAEDGGEAFEQPSGSGSDVSPLALDGDEEVELAEIMDV